MCSPSVHGCVHNCDPQFIEIASQQFCTSLIVFTILLSMFYVFILDRYM